MGTEETHFLTEDEVDLVQEPREMPPVEDFVTDGHDSFPTLFHDHDENRAATMRMVGNLERTRKKDNAVAIRDTQSLCCEAVESFISKVRENTAGVQVIKEVQFILIFWAP
ncbi:hypothetical protein BWQ96_09311 [Gracilariopsis chorda]|uniref:Uncharacterized protein n=1 Tax=Gracilariopsis chorda TaxID=448386 RepID=A0A2V3IIN1_9FLOR|nr:hypothetical protein BWQ96_09311 [Gracilariopsis chorda]|eukprot:PXF40980.1 hypothetical protein BWQ96_09311 [Gracilariopsis chorda]